MLALHWALKDTQMETYFTSKPCGDAPCSSFTVEGGQCRWSREGKIRPPTYFERSACQVVHLNASFRTLKIRRAVLFFVLCKFSKPTGHQSRAPRAEICDPAHVSEW